MKVEKIRQVVRLKQVMQRWRMMSLRRRSSSSSSSACGGGGDSGSDSDCHVPPRRIPSGYLAVYVGAERRRFVIPTRYLNLPVFVALLNEAEEELGFQPSGGLALLCEVGFFRLVLKLLERDEHRYGAFELRDFMEMASGVGFDSSCKETTKACHGFTPLLQKARV